MDNLKEEIIFNKFVNEKVRVKINACILDRLLGGCKVFLRHLEEELQYTINPCLKDDIKSISKIIEHLGDIKSKGQIANHIMLTISEFLIFRYAVKNTVALVGVLALNNKQNISYIDFVIELDNIYDTLDIDEIKVYYEFLSTYDTPRNAILN